MPDIIIMIMIHTWPSSISKMMKPPEPKKPQPWRLHTFISTRTVTLTTAAQVWAGVWEGWQQVRRAVSMDTTLFHGTAEQHVV